MGYIDGKTDTDLLLEEEDPAEDRERLVMLEVGRGTDRDELGCDFISRLVLIIIIILAGVFACL